MTVVGATTAPVASASYTPPFKYVSSVQNPVQVTGTVTVVKGTISNNPTGTAAGTSDSDYAWAYLQAHMMSTPSYRYAYLMWMIFALFAVLYAVSHHLRLSRGSLGAAVAGFGMRRHTLGSKRPGARNRALPSNNIIIAIAFFAIIAVVLSLIGSDYIMPSSSVLDFSSSFTKRAAASSTSPTYTIGKSFWTLGSRFGFMAFALLPAVVLFALKSPPIGFLSFRALTQLYADKLALLHRGVAWLVWLMTTAHVVLWTVQLFEDQRNGKPTWIYLWTNYRFIAGCVAYLFMTAVMVLSLRPVRKHRYELFYISHVVTVFLTLAACAVHHPVLWYWIAAAAGLWALERAFRGIRMVRINGFSGGKRQTPLQAGRPYSNVPTNENAYGMTELKSGQEYFPNPYADKALPRVPGVESPQRARRAETPEQEFGSKHDSELAYYDEGSLQPLGSYDQRYTDPYRDPYRDGANTPTSSTLIDGSHGHERNRSSLGTLGTAATDPTLNVTAPTFTPPAIPVGFAQAQLLPSRTVRLTIKVAHPFKWAAGQSCLLYLPDLSRVQSHPFTIINNGEPEIVILVKARKGLTRRLFNLVRSKSLAAMGVHASKDKRLSFASMRTSGEAGMQVPPVHIRAWLDGPFGSAARVRWHEYSTVVVICGGSGVSFGAAVCDYVCQMMAKSAVSSRRVKTQRVRFCWVAREYAEIAWVAGQLYRCQQMVPATQLQISIFVTNAHKVRDDFALPQPGFARTGRRDSSESVTSELSQDGLMDLDEPIDSPTDTLTNYADVIDLTNYDDEEDVNDPAEQQLSDRLQYQGKVRRAKSRKAARSQYGQQGQQRLPSARTPSGAYPPRPRIPSSLGIEESGQPRRGPSMLGLDEAAQPKKRPSMLGLDDAANQYAAAAEGHHDALSPEYPRRPQGPSSPYGSRYDLSAAAEEPLAAPRPIISPNDARRQSFRSIADSTYGRYDPFAGGSNPHGAPSPSPSMFFDDNQSIAGESVHNLLSRASRTGSMVFLEDNGADVTGDAGLWVDQADYAAMNVMAEMARPGKPKLTAVLEEEIELAKGSMIVTTCGPVTLNTVVRNLVSKHISPARIRHGDKRGNIAIYSEDYES